ncbi:MAG: DNA-directed RNA polymerase subunit D [Candidatus Diapherotrites archaeon]|nr:DNA-directed RNA polymerase subunit D [Candidatus Diapherotrites archaeon]
MRVKVLESKPNKVKLHISGTKPVIVNSLRRAILGLVPAMAITEVNIYENTSVMFDEYIAHRLAMIPLTTDLKTYKMPEECEGGGYNTCSVDLSLDVSGPKMVYSSDLKTTDPKVKPVSGKIPIIELQPGQRLRLEAKATLGYPEEHVRWQVGNAAYRYVFNVKIGKECENCLECVKACPKKVLKKGSKKIEVANPLECNGCGICKEVCKKGAIEIIPDTTSFIFTIETNGQMSARDALNTAVSALQKKVSEMREIMK